jgi:hypothetical protein
MTQTASLWSLTTGPQLHSESAHLGCVVVTPRQVVVSGLWVSSVRIILAMLHTHLQFKTSILMKSELSPRTFT